MAIVTYDGDGWRVLRDTTNETTAYVGPHYEARFTKTDKPEDLDDDCQVTVIDIMRVAAQWGQAGGPEDLDGSGTVDVGDVQRVAGQWRETCHVLAGTTKYYALGGRRVAMRKDGTLYYLFADYLGSTSVTYNTATGQTQTLRYYPWGGVRAGDTLTYDAENRTTAGQTVTFTYDGDGRRVKRDTTTDITLYLGSHYGVHFVKGSLPQDRDGDCVVTVIDIMQAVATWDGQNLAEIQDVANHWRDICPPQPVKGVAANSLHNLDYTPLASPCFAGSLQLCGCSA